MMTAVSPIFNAFLSEVVMMVGTRVSMLIESWEAAVLGLPAPSVKVLAGTFKVAGVVLFVSGMNVAV